MNLKNRIYGINMSSFPTIYQLTVLLKKMTQLAPEHWKSKEMIFLNLELQASHPFLTPLKVVNKTVLLIPGRALPLCIFTVGLWMFITSLLNNYYQKRFLFTSNILFTPHQSGPRPCPSPSQSCPLPTTLAHVHAGPKFL